MISYDTIDGGEGTTRSITPCPSEHKGYKGKITTVGSWVCKECPNFIRDIPTKTGKSGQTISGIVDCRLSGKRISYQLKMDL